MKRTKGLGACMLACVVVLAVPTSACDEDYSDSSVCGAGGQVVTVSDAMPSRSVSTKS